MRPMSMMQQRHVPVLTGALGIGLLCAALAGCGSVVASSTAAAPAAPAATTPAATTPAASATGCGAVNQASKVVLRQIVRVTLPIAGHGAVVTQTKPAVVQALLRDLCAAVSHPSTTRGVMHCPANFGKEYVGTFYDRSQVLGSFIYSPSGCRGVTLLAGGQTRYTLLSGPAAAAAPHLNADLASALGVPVSEISQGSNLIDPGGPQKPT